MALKYKVGDRVRIKDLTWYKKNKSKRGDISFPYEAEIVFISAMSPFCGQIVTILQKGYTQDTGFYRIKEDRCAYMWTDEMIEGLVEEKPKFGTASNPLEPKSNANCLTRERADELATKINKEMPSGNQNVWELPYGYQFVDENGNVINARKIVLEKKKKGYPKTYEECCRVLGVSEFEYNHTGTNVWYRHNLMAKLDTLMLCRDAYWKLYGEEMGLGKPWESDWSDYDTVKYCIIVDSNIISTQNYRNRQFTLAFPTEEMRDAFYENFKELINECKELL